MLSVVRNKIDEFIDSQSYDWSDINLSIEVIKCANYLDKIGFVRGSDYLLSDVHCVYENRVDEVK